MAEHRDPRASAYFFRFSQDDSSVRNRPSSANVSVCLKFFSRDIKRSYSVKVLQHEGLTSPIRHSIPHASNVRSFHFPIDSDEELDPD
jgi:hypothetical protein